MRENTTTRMEPLQALEEELRRLVERPHPLTLVVGDLDAALPQHPLDMACLRALLLHPSIGYQTRGAIWVRLLGLTQTPGWRGEEWPTALCAMALSGLWRTAARLRREAPELSQADVQQAALAGFWEAAVDLRSRMDTVADPGRIPSSLCWAADRAARAYRTEQLRHEEARADLGEQPEREGVPVGCPDEVLERAVERGLLGREQAELIARTRLEGVSVRELAERAGVTVEAMGMRRHRAELRLVKAVRAGLLNG
ncbi:sigma-70 RNA polymerase sigma factor region 4 domain-containing protein [Kitasatospora azatica]|uniref:sigma-70 family RNA polymerase sigma factor n=1 Tax=Kitasatospora azatica TaxID=58347 RepID=UPI000689DAF6|nr:sigma-70 family RNA polymerase sigma factor [Kitasatospora azatica]